MQTALCFEKSADLKPRYAECELHDRLEPDPGDKAAAEKKEILKKSLKNTDSRDIFLKNTNKGASGTFVGMRELKTE